MDTTTIRKLTCWIGNLDIDTAKKLHGAYNEASLSALESAQWIAERDARKTGSLAKIRRLARIAGNAVEDAAKNDPSTSWHGAWPMVAAAAEAAVWGFASTDQNVHDALTGPVRAAGFRA